MSKKPIKKPEGKPIPPQIARMIEGLSKEALATWVLKTISNNQAANLHGLWKILGAPAGKDPARWLAGDGREFSEHIIAHVGLGDRDKVIRTVDGEIGAHWQLAMAYVQFVDPLIMVMAMDVVAEERPQVKKAGWIANRLSKGRAS
jgi:hypothetical protein